MKNKMKNKDFLKSKMFTLLVLEAALIIIFSIWARSIGNNFLTANTFLNLANSLVVTAFLAIGAGCLLISGEIDLSTAAVGAFGGVIVATAIRYWDLSWPLAVLLTLLLCAAFGAANALLVTRFNFQSFIATLAMASVAKGLMMFASVPPDGDNPIHVSFRSPGLEFVGGGKIGVLPFPVILIAIAFVVYGLLMSKTKFGRRTYMVGGNHRAAWLSGIDPKIILLILFINSSVLGGVSGVLASARAMQGGLQALGSAQFTGLTAAVLGGISFGGGTGGMGGAFVGLLIINTFQTGMQIVNVNAFWSNAFSGLILIAALAMDYFSNRAKTKIGS